MPAVSGEAAVLDALSVLGTNPTTRTTPADCVPGSADESSAVVVSLRPGAAPVDWSTLTQRQWQVIFYAAGYRQTFEEVMDGPDLHRVALVVQDIVGALGLDLIRAVAQLVEYAELNGKLSLLRRLYPNEPARMSTECSARTMRGLLSGDLPAMQVATITAQWRAYFASDGEAVAA